LEEVNGGLQNRVDLCKKAAAESPISKKKSLLGGKFKKELPSDSKVRWSEERPIPRNYAFPYFVS